MSQLNFLGFDFGASSGRAMLGYFRKRKDGDSGDSSLLQRSRDALRPVRLGSAPAWCIEMKQALLKAVPHEREGLGAIGIDTWGVDFGLLDKNGNLLGLPVHYRDARTEGMVDEVCEIIPREELFGLHGHRLQRSSTPSSSCYAMKKAGDPALEMADTMLFMPDLLAYFLTGKKGVEYTIASTSQLLDPRTRNWSEEVFDRLGLPNAADGQNRAPRRAARHAAAQHRRRVRRGRDSRLSPWAGHDTASAVAAVPAKERRTSPICPPARGRCWAC